MRYWVRMYVPFGGQSGVSWGFFNDPVNSSSSSAASFSTAVALVFTMLLLSITTASAGLLGSNLFPADNSWNQNISQAPVATNSAAIISRIGNGRFHPDFGQDYRTGNPLYGIPYNVVHGNSTPKIHVMI